MNKVAVVAMAAAVWIITGCGNSNTQAKEIKETPAKKTEANTAPQMQKKAIPATAPQNKAEVSKFYTIFKDAAKIAPDGKPMLLLFGQESDPYTQKLKQEILNSDALAGRLKHEITSIYIDARGAKLHKFLHNGELMDVDTKTLISIYNIDATPTLIFADKEASHIFMVPGYMPTKQFLVTLDFLKEGLWKGKDRKNGDVYKALKQYYEDHGIAIKGKKQ